MAETKPIQIFLCHASEDRAMVLEIYDRLKSLGYTPWLDKRDLLPGQNGPLEIQMAIEASDFVLVCLSKSSVTKRGYVQREFKLVLDVPTEIPEGTIYAIPVRFDDCTIPKQFSHLHWCNLFEPDGFDYLLRALQATRASPEARATPVSPAVEARAITPPSFEPELILIPAGEFLMGSDPERDPSAQDNEQPQHLLFLPDYYLAKTPVTNAQYAAFVQAVGWQAIGSKWTGDWAEGKSPPGKADHPVNEVAWDEAMAYCRWLSEVTGRAYSLPSEAEYEKGVRGTDGRIYPWGKQWDATRCNADKGDQGDTTPVDAYPQGASPYGMLDMAGNVWEWTRSLWAYESRERSNCTAYILRFDQTKVLRDWKERKC
jgi:formylglycine-generating enzyme required for sulfatase activity